MAKKEKSNRKNGINVLLLILGVAVLSILTSLAVSEFFFPSNEPFDTYVLPYDFKVVDEVAFNLDTDILHFGGGLPGSVMERSINLTTQKDAIVEIQWQGPGLITVNKNNFPLDANAPEVVTFYLKVPEDLALGNYSGEFVFSFYEK